MKMFFLSFIMGCILGLCVWLLASTAFGADTLPDKPGVTTINLAKTGTYTYGKFVYMYIAPGLWTNTPPTGYLFIDSDVGLRPVIGNQLNEPVLTPWDSMYWHGAPKNLIPGAGWLPYPNLLAAIPQLRPAHSQHIR